jgi:hypothetical protein
VLVRMRGTDNVGAEWADIQAAVEEVKAHEVEFWKSLAVLFSPRFWKLALASVAIPFFQQFTGMNAIMFYGALFFSFSVSRELSRLAWDSSIYCSFRL